MARPKGKKDTTRFSVSLDVSSHARLSRLAELHDVSVSWLVRRAISEFIERQEQGDQAELPLIGTEGERL